MPAVEINQALWCRRPLLRRKRIRHREMTHEAFERFTVTGSTYQLGPQKQRTSAQGQNGGIDVQNAMYRVAWAD
jgi:hypothetical protein